MITPEKKFANPELLVHHEIALWAAACAEHVLPLFEKERPDDQRLHESLRTLRGWINGERTMVMCREAAFAAHTAAREAKEPSAIAAARAVGQATAVAHMYTHAPHAAKYAAKAVSLSVSIEKSEEAERLEVEWQQNQLHRELWSLVWQNN